MESSRAVPAVTDPPETLEGWYVLHQVFTLYPYPDTAPSRRQRLDAARQEIDQAFQSLRERSDAGWTLPVALIGSTADMMLVHARPSLDDIRDAEEAVRCLQVYKQAALTYTFLSVTEAGLYHLTAQLARDAAGRGGRVGDDAYRADLEKRLVAERESAHVTRRLYPSVPPDMPYVCFYPMSKRRQPGQNWYQLSLEERSRLMHAHGMTGRRYAGRVLQIITGAIGFDAWEWGVTLFAADPLQFKKLVTDMRFDEVSAKYAEFGNFHVGRILD